MTGPEGMQLALDLDDWYVTLTDGSILHVRAVGYSTEGDDLVFTALMRGTPHFEVPLVSIPTNIVREVTGG